MSIVYHREMGNTLTYRLPSVTRSLYCLAIGKSVLAILPEYKIAEMVKLSSLVRKTQNSIVNQQTLLKELRTVKKYGYAII